jgi:enamine deaminase RidA (YjgF/YER057c/UK114 family)
MDKEVVSSATAAPAGGPVLAGAEDPRLDLGDVVSCLVHLSDLSLFGRFNAVYERHFGEPRPVRTTVGASLVQGMLVEITVVAYRRGDDHTAAH